MDFSMLSRRFNLFVLLLALHCPCKFIQSPMDFGCLNFFQTSNKVSMDFGRIVFNSPSAVLRPQSPEEISLLLRVLSTSSSSKITVAARGAGHSIHGQAQSVEGIVVEMDSVPTTIAIHIEDKDNGISYADVTGGSLWIELLEESLKEGLAPRSWTDYLYLTVGGTLSNAGISGQTFKYGPQISNVLSLDVVTGKGELVTCSETQNSDLFHGVLGGLGQFGIVTSARILLQDAPQRVKWVRAFYDDFEDFTRDQELLVSIPEKVDYVEGFMVLNEQSLSSSFISFPSQMEFVSVLQTGTSIVYYCLEFAIYEYNPDDSRRKTVLTEIAVLLSYMPTHMYIAEVSYYDFLNRVRLEEMNLRSRGLWDVPHPWLNMFVPKSGITRFKDLIMENISPENFEGPILVYPILKDKWDANTSAVLPESEENVMYIVGMLQSASPDSCSSDCLLHRVHQNKQIAATASTTIGAKQYLASHDCQEGWREHFGKKWTTFSDRKSRYDPLGILSPGQNMFKRKLIAATSNRDGRSTADLNLSVE